MRARPKWASLAVCLTSASLVLTMTSAAQADSPGGPSLRQARAAWDKGDRSSLDAAEASYREAIAAGGLSPPEVLEGYSRIGAVRASLGKKEQAIAAFKAAAVLDASFTVPAEAGARGPALADRAKRDTSRIGSLKVTIDVPKEVVAGKAFKVTVGVDPSHVGIIPKVGVVAKDGTTGKETIVEPVKTAESLEFEIPGESVLPSASLVVRADALDKNANRLGSAEGRVKVPGDDKPAVVAVVKETSSPTASTASTGTSTSADTGVRKGSSFFSTPWPYIIGGIALAGLGTAVYFGTRRSDNVTIGQVGVQTK